MSGGTNRIPRRVILIPNRLPAEKKTSQREKKKGKRGKEVQEESEQKQQEERIWLPLKDCRK